MRVSDLDSDRATINAQQWFNLCLPGGNPTTASSWRKQAGIGNERRRRITQYHAFLILVRSQLDGICATLGERRPRVAEIDCFLLEQIGDRWLRQLERTGRGDARIGLLLDGDMMIENISEVLAYAGVGKSPHTQKKFLEGLKLDPTLRRNRVLSPVEVAVLRLGLALRTQVNGGGWANC